jgi:hypothetical protein
MVTNPPPQHFAKCPPLLKITTLSMSLAQYKINIPVVVLILILTLIHLNKLRCPKFKMLLSRKAYCSFQEDILIQYVPKQKREL